MIYLICKNPSCLQLYDHINILCLNGHSGPDPERVIRHERRQEERYENELSAPS